MEMNIDMEKLRTELLEAVAPNEAERIVDGTEHFVTDAETKRILFLSHLEARLNHDSEVTDLHFLRATLRDTTNAACKALNRQGINYENLTGRAHEESCTSISLQFSL